MSELIAGDFNYASVDEETATKLEYFAKSGKALIKKSQVEFIAKFGELLSDARKMLASHNKTEGTFVKWATAEFDLSSKTVYNYVNSWDRILCNGYTTYLNWSATALYLASADDFPKPVQKKLEKIPATDLVRTSDVKRLVEANKPKPEPDDDVPFDTATEMTPAEKAKAEREKKKESDAAAKAKAKADAAALKAKEKEATAAAKEKAKADAKAAREKAKADEKAAKLAELPKDEQARLNKSLAQKYIDAAVRAVDDLHRVKPNQTKRMTAIKILQGVELW